MLSGQPADASFSDDVLMGTSIDLPSFWKQERVVAQSSSQTDPITYKEQDSQTLMQRDEETQTDKATEQGFQLLKSYDYQGLVGFLTRAESLVSAQLLQNIRSSAFDGYSVEWEERISATSVAHTLTNPRKDPDVVCTELSWNKTGSVVAASYGRYDHESWCTHRGSVSAWNIARRELDPSMPNFMADTSSCVICLAFHPTIPYILAGGTFAGEVIIWHTNNEEDPVFSVSNSDELSHQEPISKIVWIPTAKRDHYNLVTIANDGKILTWDPSNKLQTPLSGSQLLIGNVPAQFRPKASKSDMGIGGTTIGFPIESRTNYLAGTEGGYIFKCTTTNATQLSIIKRDRAQAPLSLSNPIQLAYTPHLGPIQALSCSPFHRNLFLTCGSDSTLRLYNVLESRPLLTMEPCSSQLYCVQWSPFRPTVLACTGGDGMLYIYDLMHSKSVPVQSYSCTSTSAASASLVTALAFNTKDKQLLATGDSLGAIRVWRLCSSLYTSTISEEHYIQRLGGLGDGTDGGGMGW